LLPIFVSGAIIPFKLHRKGRCHIPRQRRLATNWPECDAAFHNRASLSVSRRHHLFGECGEDSEIGRLGDAVTLMPAVACRTFIASARSVRYSDAGKLCRNLAKPYDAIDDALASGLK
jgi:hypothetical protein